MQIHRTVSTREAPQALSGNATTYCVLRRKFCGGSGGGDGTVLVAFAGSSSRANVSSHASIRVRPTESTTSFGFCGTVRARRFTARTGNPSADVPAPALSEGELGTPPVREVISLMRRVSTASRSSGRAPAFAFTYASTWL